MKSNTAKSLCLFLLVIVCFGCASEAQRKRLLPILPGAYQTQDYIPGLKGKRVGIVANRTSLIGHTHLVDSLISLGINISAIFTPEHGFRGHADAGASVSNSSYKGIPVISLFGKEKKPSLNDLSHTDVVVFDLQDVGVRFYTYISTLTYVMEGCEEADKPLIVLDRPDPNGFYVDGPVLKPKFSSFVGMHTVPVVYGMTIGEYALMVKGEKWFKDADKLNLKVIKCKNYTHSSFYNLPVNPSPNLPDMRSVYLYPSLCFFEGTVVSVGRGTDFPFQIIGCPDFPDTSFSFVPESKPGASMFPPYKGKVCYGIDLRKVKIRSLRDQPYIHLSYLIDMYSKLKKDGSFFTNYFNLLAGTNVLQKQLKEGLSEDAIRKSWQGDLAKFKKIRIKYLLYPDFK